jgi:allantoinase
LEAIGRAVDLAGETGCALHVVHVSSSEGVQLITEAKARGVN